VNGRRLGHYELIEAIGSGGMAAVLRARDLELGRIVALKILPPESARDPESIIRFKQEARAAAMLDHENIARVYSCGEDQGLYFIAFEFVEGINMRVMIDRRGVLPARECIGYMIQVAAGLAHAAERGVVHRDIKPSNIVITPDGRAKIVDMGLARQLDAAGHGGVTQSGVTLGTFDYISPEQALDPRRADVRSDIYSLGCAFYHALTARPPVPEGTAAKKLHAHQHVDPLDPRQINAHIPDELVFILSRMMAKDPAKRYQTPQELIAHLKDLSERLKLSSAAIDQDMVVRAVAQKSAIPPPPRLRWGLMIGGFSAVIAIAALALSGGNSIPRSASPPWVAAHKGTPRPALADGGIEPVGPQISGHGPEEAIRTAEQLAAKLADAPAEGPTKLHIAPGVVIDLTKLSAPLTFKGKELELIGSVNSPAVFRVNASTDKQPVFPLMGSTRVGTFSLPLVVDASISSIRFEILPSPGIDDAKAAGSVGVLLPESSKVRFTDCVFSAPKGIGAIRIGRDNRMGRGDRARIRVERCVFAATTFGLWVPDWCDATVVDCGFGPHEAAVQIGESRAAISGTDNGAVQGVSIRLDRSSFLFGMDSAALRNAYPGTGSPGVRVTTGHCVFAPIGAAASFFSGVLGSRAVILRCTGNRVDTQFVGDVAGERVRRNAYYGVVPLSLSDNGESRYLTFDECKAEEFPVTDPGAVQLVQRPWAESEPDRVLQSASPWRAFRLKMTDAALFTSADEKVIGAQFYNPNGLPRWRAYPDLFGGFPPPPKTSSTEPRHLVWHPDASKEEPLPKDTHWDLAFLLTNARPGDTVLIRHNGLLSVEKSVELEKPRNGTSELRITFRADRGYVPILAAPGNDKLDQTLFRLVNGEVAFEGIQFLLKPVRPKKAQIVSAVTIIGGKACSFRDCVFTLAEEEDSPAMAVQIADPDKVMAMEPGNRPEPIVKFERCVLRGKGRGVWSPVSRAVKVDIDQSLTAIDGPIFLAEPGGKANLGVRSSLRLTRLTAFIGGPIVELRGVKLGEMRASGLVPLEVHADECLFVAVPNAGRPLVEIDGIDATEAKTVLEWKVQTANRYANFDDKAIVMIVRPGTDEGSLKELSWDQWITFAGEKDGKPVGKVMFEKAPTGLQDLASLRPADAVVKSVEFPDLTGAKPGDAGAKVDALPVPAIEP